MKSLAVKENTDLFYLFLASMWTLAIAVLGMQLEFWLLRGSSTVVEVLFSWPHSLHSIYRKISVWDGKEVRR